MRTHFDSRLNSHSQTRNDKDRVRARGSEMTLLLTVCISAEHARSDLHKGPQSAENGDENDRTSAYGSSRQDSQDCSAKVERSSGAPGAHGASRSRVCVGRAVGGRTSVDAERVTKRDSLRAPRHGRAKVEHQPRGQAASLVAAATATTSATQGDLQWCDGSSISAVAALTAAVCFAASAVSSVAAAAAASAYTAAASLASSLAISAEAPSNPSPAPSPPRSPVRCGRLRRKRAVSSATF
eukprot:4232376-Pleurochrysis_carterae.AAC.3